MFIDNHRHQLASVSPCHSLCKFPVCEQYSARRACVCVLPFFTCRNIDSSGALVSAPSGFCRPGFTRARLFFVFVIGLRVDPPPPLVGVWWLARSRPVVRFDLFSCPRLLSKGGCGRPTFQLRGKGRGIQGVSPTHLVPPTFLFTYRSMTVRYGLSFCPRSALLVYQRPSHARTVCVRVAYFAPGLVLSDIHSANGRVVASSV